MLSSREAEAAADAVLLEPDLGGLHGDRVGGIDGIVDPLHSTTPQASVTNLQM